MEGTVLAFTALVGGLTFLLALSPVGKALADRLRGARPRDALPEVFDEMDELRGEVSELHERIEFMERLIAAKATEPEVTPTGDAGRTPSNSP